MIKETYEEIIEMEAKRQRENVELIASENFPSQRVLDAAGSILTNKYAEGYPGKRYYGSSANQAVYRALIKAGDTVLGMDLGAGGHLTHGHKMSFSGQDYDIVSYGVDDNGVLDYEDFAKKLNEHKPKMVIVGASSYSQIIDYKRINDILEDYAKKNNCDKPFYMVDMAHVAGLIAGGVHPSPFPYADVVTSTTHKTLRGPRGGIILTNSEEIIQKINKTVFPGIQGGPLMHVIGAKAECFYEALKPEFKTYQKQVLKNIKAMSDEFIKLGMKVVSGGTDNHLILLNVYDSLGITGKEAEKLLDKCHITVNKNTIPGEKLSPMKASGIRIGSPAMTTRGFTEKEFVTIAKYIYEILTNKDNEKKLKEISKKVVMLGRKFPINNI